MKGWKESRKDNLAEVLKGLVEDMKWERKFVGLREGQKPFVEIDERNRGYYNEYNTPKNRNINMNLLSAQTKKVAVIRAVDSDGYVLGA